jgi:opacity protein-like surface antigen
MKRILMATALALALGGTANAAIVDYLALYGGGTMDPTLRYGSGTSSMDTGYNVGAAFGWNVSPQLSVGADMMFTHSGYSCCTSSLESFSVMANGIYSFDIGSQVRPFVGLGAGAVNVTYDGASQFPTFSGSQFVFGYQGEAGVSVPIATKVGLILAYKYQGAADASIEGKKVEYKSNNVSVGLVFDLN